MTDRHRRGANDCITRRRPSWVFTVARWVFPMRKPRTWCRKLSCVCCKCPMPRSGLSITLNHKRSLWRRVTREFESSRWFERALDESADERAAMRCLGELPVPQREVIVLKLWHDYTFEEIGELLEVSPHTAAGRYRYGLEKLRACMKGELHERHEHVGGTVAFLETAPPIAKA